MHSPCYVASQTICCVSSCDLTNKDCVARSRHTICSRTKPGAIHCTRIWNLRQVSNRRAGPIKGLMETSLPPRSRIWQAVKVLTPDRCLGKFKIGRMTGLIMRFFGHSAGGTEDAKRCTTPYRIDMQGAGARAPAPFCPADCYPSNRAYSSSTTLSSSFLKSGAGLRNAWPAGSSLGAQVPIASL
jgi:hypothetical protein